MSECGIPVEGDRLREAVLAGPGSELYAATQHAVTELRGFGYFWSAIAARLGATRQTAQQRWGR